MQTEQNEPPVPADPRERPSPENGFQHTSAHLLLRSHRLLVGRALLPGPETASETARRLYEAPFVVLAHDTGADPVFFYANRAAQRLFERDWDALVRLPSRFSAEAPAREARQRLLERVGRDGYIDDYAGVRVSASGQRFQVIDATVWNLIDASGQHCGQAASFARWQALDPA